MSSVFAPSALFGLCEYHSVAGSRNPVRCLARIAGILGEIAIPQVDFCEVHDVSMETSELH